MSIEQYNSLTSQYHFVRHLGKGSYAQIFQVVSIQTGKHLAIKVMHIDKNSLGLSQSTYQKIHRQIEIIVNCDHQNIIRCHGVKIVDQRMVWIILQLCQSGSLTSIMINRKRPFDERQIRVLCKQILQGLHYLHSRKVIHRDIKASNLLLKNDGSLKIADFGVSGVLVNTLNGKNTFTGSPYWMSPELLSRSKYSFKTDIWSLGITLLQLAQGQPPYAQQHPYKAMFSIKSNPPQGITDPMIAQSFSKRFHEFIKKCLMLDQNTRPTAFELLLDNFLTYEQNSIIKNLNFESTLFKKYNGMTSSSCTHITQQHLIEDQANSLFRESPYSQESKQNIYHKIVSSRTKTQHLPSNQILQQQLVNFENKAVEHEAPPSSCWEMIQQPVLLEVKKNKLNHIQQQANKSENHQQLHKEKHSLKAQTKRSKSKQIPFTISQRTNHGKSIPKVQSTLIHEKKKRQQDRDMIAAGQERKKEENLQWNKLKKKAKKYPQTLRHITEHNRQIEQQVNPCKVNESNYTGVGVSLKHNQRPQTKRQKQKINRENWRAF